jgi:prefoldin subunit 5
MSHNRNIEEFINAFVFSFIITMILIAGRDVIQLLNDKIEKLNSEIERLNMLIEDNNIKNNFHLKEIEASYNTKLDDFNVKYNADILAINANIVTRSNSVSRQQDEIIKNAVNNQDETIKTMLDTVDELNDQMSAVQFNISSIMGHRNEYNNFINNELVAIRSKINELELEMPVCIGSDLRHCIEIFANPKIRTNILTSDYLSSLNIECLKRLPLIKYIDMIGFNRITINEKHKFISDLTSEEKTYIKQICDKRGIQLVNSGF